MTDTAVRTCSYPVQDRTCRQEGRYEQVIEGERRRYCGRHSRVVWHELAQRPPRSVPEPTGKQRQEVATVVAVVHDRLREWGYFKDWEPQLYSLTTRYEDDLWHVDLQFDTKVARITPDYGWFLQPAWDIVQEDTPGYHDGALEALAGWVVDAYELITYGKPHHDYFPAPTLTDARVDPDKFYAWAAKFDQRAPGGGLEQLEPHQFLHGIMQPDFAKPIEHVYIAYDESDKVEGVYALVDGVWYQQCGQDPPWAS